MNRLFAAPKTITKHNLLICNGLNVDKNRSGPARLLIITFN